MRNLLAMEQAMEQIKVVLLSEIVGMLIVRSRCDNAKPVSLPISQQQWKI